MGRILSSVFLLLLSAAFVFAQAQAPDAAALKGLLNEFLAGAGRNDPSVHERFWAEELIYTGSSGRRVGKADIMRDVRSAPAPKASDPQTVYTAEDVRIQQYGDMAVVAFRLVGTTTKGGAAEVSKFLNTGTFIRRGGRWQAVSWQATRLPRAEDEVKKEVAAAASGLTQVRPRTVPLDDLTGLKARNVKTEMVIYKGRRALRVADAAPDAGDGERLVTLNGAAFQDGVIEIDLTGEPGPGAREGARGFVGVAFRVASEAKRYECFYLRPTNGRAEDQVRRNHSVQYISFPDFPWQLLRKEFPEKYESYADLVPGEWTQVKIEVRGDKARLFLHGAQQPSLLVNDLKHGQSQGGIALWVGPGTVAHFSNLRVSK